jgi:hypothetical protein
MFQPNQPSSGVQVVMMKVSAAHCNAVLLYYWSSSEDKANTMKKTLYMYGKHMSRVVEKEFVPLEIKID